jgi:hypothetical protein
MSALSPTATATATATTTACAACGKPADEKKDWTVVLYKGRDHKYCGFVHKQCVQYAKLIEPKTDPQTAQVFPICRGDGKTVTIFRDTPA